MALQLDMSGKVVLVTGGTRGVGAGIAEMFLKAGAHVEVCARTEPPELPAHFSRLDVRDPDQVERWIEDVARRCGRVDVAVNNAGGAPYADFADASPRFHRRVTELNFLAPVYVCRAVFPVMADGGLVLNVTSISARRVSPGTAVYGAAKAALESLTASLAVEWAPKVRVNAVSCGLVETPGSMDHYGDAEQVARVAATIPRGVFARPEDVGGACVLLASPLAAHVTGAVLNVDGGGEWPGFLRHTPNA
ncbi:SDR family oxidoreductase [Streptomyces acidiscabies]|uniref:SDR family oxidoreductase n=1 Tax=Streptomyces acidiscabies TaxID=42234 RepID=A0AAP6BFF4_9ACTN|nr:SDR family oxidoreductase [Streptomyces acidiscabies]MBZ3917389.1 SDR family oxidoreductase [Streptomyces acidiscabies]MDX2963472.1 SDR family oxidoreductase [Streptomyces acidiscabies]MDX3018769.1 SDR family oxidoreductase [Streptomyces acidiscabies]MDX3790559.1 SDR family oxidoreductase [Streptomyces acidiscabies]GAV43222.1 glucose 1-dehydrogenase 1 [Streptomyces acidiscabies]